MGKFSPPVGSMDSCGQVLTQNWRLRPLQEVPLHRMHLHFAVQCLLEFGKPLDLAILHPFRQCEVRFSLPRLAPNGFPVSRGPTPSSQLRHPVSNDEETEIAILAEVEREIYQGMEILEDAFEGFTPQSRNGKKSSPRAWGRTFNIFCNREERATQISSVVLQVPLRLD